MGSGGGGPSDGGQILLGEPCPQEETQVRGKGTGGTPRCNPWFKELGPGAWKSLEGFGGG